ncbi:unnamed protein product, partial [Amoebophrya sp. A25]|eukprot:GSA25T00024656001.1
MSSSSESSSSSSESDSGSTFADRIDFHKRKQQMLQQKVERHEKRIVEIREEERKCIAALRKESGRFKTSTSARTNSKKNASKEENNPRSRSRSRSRSKENKTRKKQRPASQSSSSSSSSEQSDSEEENQDSRCQSGQAALSGTRNEEHSNHKRA